MHVLDWLIYCLLGDAAESLLLRSAGWLLYSKVAVVGRIQPKRDQKHIPDK